MPAPVAGDRISEAWNSESSLYRDCYGLSPLKIYKDILHFRFQFEVDFTFSDIKVKNV